MVYIPKIIQLKNKKGWKLYPIINSYYCIEDDSIAEKKLSSDIQEKINDIVIELVNTGETSSGRIIYKPSDDSFINKVANYYYLFNSGKPVSFFFIPTVEDNITKTYQIPVKQFVKNGRSGFYYLYGRNGDYNIECTVETFNNSVWAYVNVDSIGTGDIRDAAVTTDAISAEAVTTGKIADNSIITPKLVNQSVTTDKLADGSVTSDKLANSENYLMKANLQTINVSWYVDVDTQLNVSSVDTLNAAYKNMEDNLPVTFKVAYQAGSATNGNIYSSSGYYSSTWNKSTLTTSYTIGTYFRVPLASVASTVYKLEISWKSNTTDMSDVTITIEAI